MATIHTQSLSARPATFAALSSDVGSALISRSAQLGLQPRNGQSFPLLLDRSFLPRLPDRSRFPLLRERSRLPRLRLRSFFLSLLLRSLLRSLESRPTPLAFSSRARSLLARSAKSRSLFSSLAFAIWMVTRIPHISFPRNAFTASSASRGS